MAGILKPLEMAKHIVGSALTAGDVVVDATLGNGHDALFLANCVGSDGLVYGFDVQQVAVENSAKRMKKAAMQNGLFFCIGHEEMDRKIETEHHGKVAAVMFNLGYLPSADKTIISQAETTLAALQKAMYLLKTGGILSVMCYPGHEGGDLEADEVLAFVGKLERDEWRVLQYQFINAPNRPAFLIIGEKL